MSEEKVKVSDADTGRVYSMPPSELAPGMVGIQIVDSDGNASDVVYRELRFADIANTPIRHESLPDDLMELATAIYEVIGEALEQEYDQFVDGFRHDRNPDRELGIWANIAGAYRHFTAGRTLNIDQKRDILRFLIVAFVNGEQVLRTFTCRTLSKSRMRAMWAEIVRRSFAD
jgi:hypothetical protein